ncbi:MAG TPA: hypothetical protein VM779_04145 [Thermoanaerobaculia bacterium]|nr:hypothetical protein [Thermoanaerobaculia bacterium]
MTREGAGEVIAWTAICLLCVATVARYADRGGPYLQPARTVLEHAGPEPHPLQDALVVVPEARALIPRGASVAVVRARAGQALDDGNYLTAVDLLPHHRVLPAFAADRGRAIADLPEYVVALGTPFDHPHYGIVAGFPNGWLYRVQR